MAPGEETYHQLNSALMETRCKSARLRRLGAALGVLLHLACPGLGKVMPNDAMVWDGNGFMALTEDDSAPLPPPPKTDSWKRSDTSIFIGVSSFRDKRCPRTLFNFYTKAKHPERIFIGVVQQNAVGDVDCVAEYCHLMGADMEGPDCPHWENIRTVRVEDRLAAGPCYGRHLQSYMLREEEFCMQTDSHMDVAPDWDYKLMQMWGRAGNEYGILTTYVHRMEQLSDNLEKKREVPHLCQVSFTAAQHPRYVQAKIASGLPAPKLTNTWAAGFSLARCHAWRAAPYDPGLRMVFDGEEFSMHARLWTRGYDTYTPDVSIVGHDYNKVTEGPAPGSWVSNPVERGTKAKSYVRLFSLLGMPNGENTAEMRESLGKYGLGTKRTMKQYQNFVGVNLTTLEIGGSRCGTLSWVPFNETWPPTENNLAGPYWERRLKGKGIHSSSYKGLLQEQTGAGVGGQARGPGADSMGSWGEVWLRPGQGMGLGAGGGHGHGWGAGLALAFMLVMLAGVVYVCGQMRLHKPGGIGDWGHYSRGDRDGAPARARAGEGPGTGTGTGDFSNLGGSAC